MRERGISIFCDRGRSDLEHKMINDGPLVARKPIPCATVLEMEKTVVRNSNIGDGNVSGRTPCDGTYPEFPLRSGVLSWEDYLRL